MGKVLDTFKHLLYEEDEKKEEEKNEDVKKEEDEKKEPIKESVAKVAPAVIETAIDKVTDPIYSKLIQASMQSSGDYARFADMLESLRSTLPDDRICFKAAFTAASKISPMTPQSLIKSLEGCIRVLDEEKARFQSTIQSRQADIDTLRKQVQDRNDQIVKLQAEISELLQKINDETGKNEQVGLSFDRALKAARHSFESMIMKVSNYLGEEQK